MRKNYFIESERNNTVHGSFYYFEQGFTEEEVNKIIHLGSKHPLEAGIMLGEREGYRKNDVSWIKENEESEWVYDIIAYLAKSANDEMWKFDLCDYQDPLQYTIYDKEGSHYDWHMDLGPSLSNRKLSCVVQLSDSNEYEGGVLELNIGEAILSIPKKKGLVCFFPSFIIHRVTPSVSGTRKSLVAWISGNNFR